MQREELFVKRPIRIGIVVGEISGDHLAVNLIRALKRIHPDIRVEGILGPELLKEGGDSLYPMERLAVMGLIEPLARLPELFRIRSHLIRYFTKNPPDIFIGVDAPDFNLGLEKALKKQGIRTVHYVSPSVWAWRRGRIKTIKKAVDLMLTLFPFEAKFYEEHQVPVYFTGHPLADQISISPPSILPKSGRGMIALLPGSRRNELRYLAETFLLTARLCYEKNPTLQFVMPLVSESHKAYVETLKKLVADEVPIQFLVGGSHLAIAAADVVLVTSGTATLEVMLHQKPMVVAYRMHALSYYIVRGLIKIPYIALPNLLAEEKLVPEYIQNAATPEALSAALLEYLDPEFNDKRVALVDRFRELHQRLKQDASQRAAEIICDRFLND